MAAVDPVTPGQTATGGSEPFRLPWRGRGRADAASPRPSALLPGTPAPSAPTPVKPSERSPSWRHRGGEGRGATPGPRAAAARDPRGAPPRAGPGGRPGARPREAAFGRRPDHAKPTPGLPQAYPRPTPGLPQAYPGPTPGRRRRARGSGAQASRRPPTARRADPPERRGGPRRRRPRRPSRPPAGARRRGQSAEIRGFAPGGPPPGGASPARAPPPCAGPRRTPYHRHGILAQRARGAARSHPPGGLPLPSRCRESAGFSMIPAENAAFGGLLPRAAPAPGALDRLGVPGDLSPETSGGRSGAVRPRHIREPRHIRATRPTTTETTPWPISNSPSTAPSPPSP